MVMCRLVHAKELHAGIMLMDANEASRYDKAIIMIVTIITITRDVKNNLFCESARAELAVVRHAAVTALTVLYCNKF